MTARITTAAVLGALSGACATLHAQTGSPPAPAAVVEERGGLALGLSGLRSSDGTTVQADIMWAGVEMTDGAGVRILREALGPKSHGYAAMLFIGGPPSDAVQWFRLDFGMGYVGQQSDRALPFLRRHGLGVQLGSTIAPVRLGFIRPELNGWAIVGTSAQFLGASLGVRLLDPRHR